MAPARPFKSQAGSLSFCRTSNTEYDAVLAAQRRGLVRCPMIRSTIAYIVLMLALYPLGVICHEVLGHGLTGALVGGRVVRVEILGLDIWPRLQWKGWQGHYGYCDVRGISTRAGEAAMALAGSLSTWVVSIIAIALLYWRRWSREARAVLLCLGLWWMDMLTYTLPSWGLPRSVLWGQREFSEPYEAAVALGLPGRYFQIAVILSSVLLLLAWIGIVTRMSRRLPARPSSAAVGNKSPQPAASR